MSGEVIITVVGNLTGDPELKFLPTGACVANFTVASTPRTFDKATNEWRDGEPLFLRCSLWRDAAEHAVESLAKGMRVIVSGYLKQRSYEKDGQKHTVVELEVEEIGPSLKYATAKVTKAERGGGNSGGQSQGGRPQPPSQQNRQSGGGWGDSGGAAQGGWSGSNSSDAPF